MSTENLENSEKFDVPKITGAIAMEAAQMACDRKNLNQIQDELKKILTNKRILLVLDDVWNENFNYWELLLTPLKSGAPGSRIIITTRNKNVATTVHSSSTFSLRELDPTACWQLFCKYAFDDQNPPDNPRFKEIGEEIVKRCQGLPLAVKAMGGALSIKKDVKFWEKVLKNDLWNISNDGVLPVLRLSYRYLPSRLKQCFAYCSIFPKNYKFKKEELILLWMAEGFLIEQGNETMEEVGEEYFEKLVSRSFFQLVDNSFVMHDLIKDLARVVAGDFCFRFENQEICRTFERLRYFSLDVVKEKSSSQQLSSIFKSGRLRTFLSLYNTWWKKQGNMLEEMIPDLFLNQQRLRVLSLSHCEKVVELSSSISRLKHLRYLDLSYTSITSLPECLCSFYNLQTLKLCRCMSLAKLPTKMGRMIGMHHLDIQRTKLQEMPPNMGKLIKLQTLTDFFVEKREGCGVKELGSLKQLGGTLTIHNLQHVVSATDVFEAKIKCKKNLKELHLYWKSDPDGAHHEEAVLDWLQPHAEIEVISIIGYGGTRFPNWLVESSFTKLVSLTLKGCKYCSSLPLVGHMSSLKYLEVRGFNEVRIIDSDFFDRCVSAVKPFQFLEVIRFKDMPQWQKWTPYGGEGESESGAFPCLKELSVRNCPNLEGALPIHLPSLTNLVIENCPQLQNYVPNAPNLSSLQLANGDCLPFFSSSNHLAIVDVQESVLEKIGQLSSLVRITITEHETLKCFPLEPLPKLRVLRIKRCTHFESFCTPNEEFLSFEFLTMLFLENCPKLKCLPERMRSLLPALSWLEIVGCSEIKTFSREGLPLKLESLAISNCNNLIAGRMNWNLNKLTSLTSFSIKDYEAEEMECFPDVALLPSTLTSLTICGLPCLKFLNYEEFKHFDSLKKLIISRCDKLRLVSDEVLSSTRGFQDLTCLRELGIWHCSEIASLPELPPNLISLSLDLLHNLRSWEGLRHLTSLKCLDIHCYYYPETLPLCHLTSLKSLTIGGCRNLKTLPEEGLPSSLCHLTSLKSLTIGGCRNMKTLPEEGLPSSLSSLRIWGNPLLKKRYGKKKGKYWAKISHIAHVDIEDW